MDQLINDCLTNEELIALAKACEKLRSINTKKQEHRDKYIALFTPFHELYSKVVATRDRLYETRTDQSQTRPAFTKIFVAEVRERQIQAGAEKYLINDVKFGFILNIVHWLQHPELQTKQSDYIPRGFNKRDRKKKEKKESTIKILSMDAKVLSCELIITEKDPVQRLNMIFNNNVTASITIPEIESNNKKSKHTWNFTIELK